MSTELPRTLPSATRPINPELSALLERLQPGQRIRITQQVRVGGRKWTTTVTGTFREIRYLSTGLATDRVPHDAILVVAVRFLKDNGELSSVTLDGHSRIEAVEG